MYFKTIIITIILFIVSNLYAQDTIKTFYKVYNFGKQNREVCKCFVIQNSGVIDTICVKVPSAQAQRDSSNFDTTMANLKSKIESDYKADLKTYQELQTKILKEESYLEILNYLIEERKK